MKHLALLVSILWSVALLVPVLLRRGGLPFPTGLIILALCGVGGLVLGTSNLRPRREPQERLTTAGLAALVLGSSLLLTLLGGVVAFPWTSDTAAADRPPRFQALEPTETSPSAEPQPHTESSLGPLALSTKAPLAFGHAVAGVRQLPNWQTAKFDAFTHHLEGTIRSPLFGTATQLAIDVRESGTGSVIEVRARSNLPVGDFGENARVIRHFFEQLRGTWMCRPPPEFAARQTKG